MQNNIQTSFSIKDLENLSGVKAHTIRIWEKRYKLLTPKRSNTNIRTYDIQNLKRLLNLAYLNKSGFKISKLGELSEIEIAAKVQELIVSKNYNDYAHGMFKLAMLNFDTSLFDNTYHKLLQESSFRDIFLNVFIKLLDEIGLLWQNNTIQPVHERFISNLITQKVLINTEKTQYLEHTKEKSFILFLPLNETHELGLLFINFELSLKGYRVIFLGQNVPIEDLKALQAIYGTTEFVSYFTVEPPTEKLHDYLAKFKSEILDARNEKLHIIGRNSQNYSNNYNTIIKHNSINDLLINILS